MFSVTLRQRVLAVFVLAAVGVGSFLAVRLVTGNEASRADPGTPSEEHLEVAPKSDLGESEGPRFTGELLGMFIGPENAPVPSEFQQREDALKAERPPCRTSRLERSFDRAGPYHLAFGLPPPYRLDAEKSGVIVCNDQETSGSAHWEYQATFNNFQSVVHIARGRPRAIYTIDVAADRVSEITIGGRRAILIAPLNPDTGYGSSATIVFPGPDVLTSVGSNNVPVEELLRVGDIIGSALEPE
jgi:hypothetical protein